MNGMLNGTNGVVTCILASSSGQNIPSIVFAAIAALLAVTVVIVLVFARKKRIAAEREFKKQLEERNVQLASALALAERANEAKTDFTAHMGHEIRAPLNAVIGYIKIAIHNFNDHEKVGDCIRKADISAQLLLHIITDLLDMSAIECGKMVISHERFDFRKLLTGISSDVHTLARLKKIKFSISINGLNEEFFAGDENRIRQVLMNLLSNAVKFTDEGGCVSFEVEESQKTEKLTYFKFVVSDTGIGISEECAKYLFEPFQQSVDRGLYDSAGTGLGLPIAKNLITMMNGTIEYVSSEAGTGFTVVIPLERCGSDIRSNYSMTDVRILVADDQQNSGDYTRTILERYGVSDIKLCGIDSSAELIDIADKNGTPFDFCIIDGGEDESESAIGAVEKINALDLGKRTVLFVVVYDRQSVEKKEWAYKVDGFIERPVFPSSLMDLLISKGGYGDGRDAVSVFGYDLNGIRILLAEDNEMNREIATEILSISNVRVDQAFDGVEAYDKFVSSPVGTYDMILMDIQMPRMNGYDSTRRIRESNHPEAKTIPIVAMTADAFREDVAKVLATGMNAHISKPIEVDVMLTTIQQNLRKAE